MKKLVEMYGEMVEVEVCKPSKRKANSRITKGRYNRCPQRGAKYVAKENGQYKEDNNS